MIDTPSVAGMVTTDNDILIVSDWNNKVLKVFSADKLLSSVKLSTACYGVTVTEDKVAIVSTFTYWILQNLRLYLYRKLYR